MKKYLIPALLALSLASSPGFAGLKAGALAPGFNLKNLQGQPVKLDDLTAKGHVLLVFWESECVYCLMHVEEFNQLHDTFNNKGLTVAAINLLGEPEETIVEYSNNYNTRYLMLTDRAKSIDATNAYKVIGSPTIVMVSPDNKILYYGHKIPDISQWLKQP